MKDNYIHVCFILDESGSMSGSESDVIGGFQKVIDEQKAEKKGDCSISLFKFNSYVSKVYRGKDIDEVKPLVSSRYCRYDLSSAITSGITDVSSDSKVDNECTYSPGGGTAMFDGIGTAIDDIGEWLNEMPESDRPSKNLIVIMTDGEENSSRKYSGSKIKEMIKHQEEKYNWSFVYMGTDLSTRAYADTIGIKNQVYSVRTDLGDNYSYISKAASVFRNCSAETADMSINSLMDTETKLANSKYYTKTGINLSK